MKIKYTNSIESITFGSHDTALGHVIIGIDNSTESICWLSFNQKDGQKNMKSFWRGTRYNEDTNYTKMLIDNIIDLWMKQNTIQLSKFSLTLRATEFQKEVWTALCQIPFGQTASYQDIANKIDRPNAVRAVGSANARNPVSLLIPCHRVIQKNGKIGQYNGGTRQKEFLLNWESEQIKKSNAA